ncbi:DUF3846 domain-containing protein [Lachnospiraceae bacterium LCP19S3_B12]
MPNTLEDQQRAVDGLIQYIRNEDDTVIVINEESKINGIEDNRRIDGDVLVGPVFIAGDTGESICSLTDEQIQKYVEKFAEPEEIPPDLGMKVSVDFYCDSFLFFIRQFPHLVS